MKVKTREITAFSPSVAGIAFQFHEFYLRAFSNEL